MRMQLLEIEDQPWCPAPIRDAATDYLQFIVDRYKPYRAIAPQLAGAIAHTDGSKVVDLCSGAGGPWRSLLSDVASRGVRVEVTMTDRYPNAGVAREVNSVEGSRRHYHVVAVDATDVPAALTGFRTMFASFHHFAPDAAQRILRDAVVQRRGIGIFELTERRPAAILGMLLAPIILWLVTPRIRPFRWSRLFWTYLVPVVPLVVMFDGIVSCLRTYTPGELVSMTADLTAYDWDIGTTRVPGVAAAVTYLIGTPRDE